MFQITRQADYGLLLVSALASRYQEDYVSLRQIAEERKLPYRFLSKIIIPLRKAGIVKSYEGATGGYRLAMDPKKIMIRDVLVALGEDLTLVRCENDDKQCQSFCQCNSRGFWHELQEKINQVLSGYTVADLVKNSTPNEKPNVTFRRLIAIQ
ncbi:MAG: Rrf2 family transcriptional regulator [Candidatus Peregrinibacteria bacterium]|nr:Rrf2 family transcriptional regulator [Candidatus Peregrinibacteria bacterium]